MQAKGKIKPFAFLGDDFPLNKGDKTMDRKAKKRLEVLRKKMIKLQQQLAGVKEQADEPEEITEVENEIAKAQSEIDSLKNS